MIGQIGVFIIGLVQFSLVLLFGFSVESAFAGFVIGGLCSIYFSYKAKKRINGNLKL